MKGVVSLVLLLVLVPEILSGCVDGLFYQPDRKDHGASNQPQPSLQAQPQPYEDVYFKSRDGVRLHGWYVPAKGSPLATVVHFHGNAQNITAHFAFVSWLTEAGYNVFSFDYRGYGKSEGKPDRQGVHDDALAALDYIASREDTGSPDLVILGQSLGGAIAIVAAAERKQRIRAVVIDATFSSYRGIAKDKAQGVPVIGSMATESFPLLLPSNGYAPIDYVARIAPVPLLILHGTADPVIPVKHGRELYEKAGEPRILMEIEGGGHIEAFSRFRPWVQPVLLEFLNQALSRGKPMTGSRVMRISP